MCSFNFLNFRGLRHLGFLPPFCIACVYVVGTERRRFNLNKAVLIFVTAKLLVGLTDIHAGEKGLQTVSRPKLTIISHHAVCNYAFCMPRRDTTALAARYVFDPIWNSRLSNRNKFLDHVVTMYNQTSHRDLSCSQPRTIILGLIMCAGDVQPNPGPARPSNRKKSSAKACSSCSKLVIGKNKLTCSDCQLLFHPSCVGVKQKQLSNLRANSAQWYCSDCCAPCSMCDGNVLRDHHAVQCDSCDKWLHTACCDIDYQLYTSLMASNCTWVCPLCSELNFSDSFFSEGEISTENPFDALDTDADADVCSQPASQKDVGATQPKPNSNRNQRYNKENRKCNAKKRDKVKLILTNCQSVRSKAGDIEVLIDSVKPDFICGTESWLDPDVNSSEIFPESQTTTLSSGKIVNS